MRSYPKKALILLFGIIMVISSTACRLKGKPEVPKVDNNETIQTNTQPQAESSTNKDSSKPKYFFINGSLLGSYDSEGWHSLNNTSVDASGEGTAEAFYAKDLLDQEAYYIYDVSKQLGVSKQVIWATEEAGGIGSFDYTGFPEKFSKYGRVYQYDGDSAAFSRIFDLPLKLGDELSKLKVPDYGFYTEFVFGDGWNRDTSRSYRFVTNSSINPLPKELTYGAEPTNEGKEMLIKLFKENGMDNTIPNFSECILGDFDRDGKDEYLMVANSPRSELNWPTIKGEGKKDKVGTFSAVLYQDDSGNFQVLHSDMRPLKEAVEFKDGYKEIEYAEYCHMIEFPRAIDLNGDGVFEITFVNGLWEGGYTVVFSQNKEGVYSAVMRSNWGM